MQAEDHHQQQQQRQKQQLDEIDRKLLNDIQWVFPLADRPYEELGKKHGLSEDEVMRRISSLRAMGLVRQINAIFDTRRLGYKSALIAFAVRPDRLDAVAEKVNEHPASATTMRATTSTTCGSRLQCRRRQT